jgi:hypothetical protein
MEGSRMPAIVDYPHVVKEALAQFGDLFANEPQRRHFADYLTGLYVVATKTVSEITREFPFGTDQSCLNRFLSSVEWDPLAINDRRLAWLQQHPSTRYSKRGAIALDNTLIDHTGELIADVGWFWDHVDQRHKIAHDYLFANYVCPNGKHYPLEFRRFKKREQCLAENVSFRSHTDQLKELVDWTCEKEVPGLFTFDSYFTNAPILNHIHSKKLESGESRAYIGSLKFNRNLHYRGELVKANALAATIPATDRKPIRTGHGDQWYFTHSLGIPEVKHKVRIVIIWNQPTDVVPRIMLVSNRTYWEATRVVSDYGHRWTGTETYHRDGKQNLGMGDCQLRSSNGQTRHMYMVMLAYSLLMRQLKQTHSGEWTLHTLMTIGDSCRAIMREVLRLTLLWAIDRVTTHHWEIHRVFSELNLM